MSAPARKPRGENSPVSLQIFNENSVSNGARGENSPPERSSGDRTTLKTGPLPRGLAMTARDPRSESAGRTLKRSADRTSTNQKHNRGPREVSPS
jgi:hypothetical protein